MRAFFADWKLIIKIMRKDAIIKFYQFKLNLWRKSTLARVRFKFNSRKYFGIFL